MIIFLRNEYSPRPRTDTVCMALRASFVEFFPNRIEFMPAWVAGGDNDITQIDVVGDCYRFGDTYEYCEVYDDEREDSLKEAYPKCKWFDFGQGETK